MMPMSLKPNDEPKPADRKDKDKDKAKENKKCELQKAKSPFIAERAFLKVVGERGFEPPTHWSQTSCATKLRYSPISCCTYY
ncbi:hypothetical protein ALQ63_02533 [Serratia plymuthica]|nr:hypothetical protein ALQ63_02533 [Serratia plymuthica]